MVIHERQSTPPPGSDGHRDAPGPSRPVLERSVATFLSRSVAVGVALTGLLVSGSSSQSPDPIDSRPNVLLISIDTLRPDHLTCYGYGRDTTPFLDSLAKRGVVFENAFAQASWTLPSHMSLMTSTYPHTHRVEDEDRTLPAGIPTLAEALDGAGYRTIGFVTWIYLSARFGFGRGFDRYEEILPSGALDDALEHAANADDVVTKVIGSWDPTVEKETPFFLFLHFFDPHLNYSPPIEYARAFGDSLVDGRLGRYDYLKTYIKGLHPEPPPVPEAVLRGALSLYDAEIRFVDDQLRRLFVHLDSEGLLENTIIIVTSDHGEEFGEHGSLEGHQWTLYDEVLRVPLIVVFPESTPFPTGGSGRWTQLVQSLDIAPTILDVVGIERPASFEGRSFRALFQNPERWEEASLAQIRRFNQKWSLRTPTHKLIFTQDTRTNRFGVPIKPGYELFDLVADPGETRDIFSEQDSLSVGLARRLRRWAGERSRGETVADPQFSPEERERLRSVGYIGR